jgi:hypothetical protein
MIVVVLIAVPRQPRGAADEPGREAGIVLRRQDDSRTEYEGEESLE